MWRNTAMGRYGKRILNALLDSYERSAVFMGTNKVAVHISFPFQKKTIPEYFDEGSLAYEDIHAELRELEQRGWLQIVWRRGKEGHIVQKAVLVEEKADSIYSYLGRTPKAQRLDENIRLFEELGEQYASSVCRAFLYWLLERLRQGKSVKEFLAIENPEESARLIRAVHLIETNAKPCYLREFSVSAFGDSKALEGMLGTLGKVFRRFDGRLCDMDISAILAEHEIYQTPNYVYLKGEGSLKMGESLIRLSSFRQGIGISGEDIGRMELLSLEKVKKVITIENLTTFFRWAEPESMIIYLGGYHNSLRRRLLCMVYDKLPEAEYLHFGDIDVGGFEIYEDLCAKTKIPFHPYYMDLDTLIKYQSYARPLTDTDKKRIHLRLQAPSCPYRDLFQYMLVHNLKLEQECIQEA